MQSMMEEEIVKGEKIIATPETNEPEKALVEDAKVENVTSEVPADEEPVAEEPIMRYLQRIEQIQLSHQIHRQRREELQ